MGVAAFQETCFNNGYSWSSQEGEVRKGLNDQRISAGGSTDEVSTDLKGFSGKERDGISLGQGLEWAG